MIFIAKNENGEPSWKLIQEGKKDVTRRIKPLPVGKEFAVQPGRGKFAVCRARVVSCVRHEDWVESIWRTITFKELQIKLDEEAKREGFDKWLSLYNWFENRNILLIDLYRIEFELDNRSLE